MESLFFLIFQGFSNLFRFCLVSSKFVQNHPFFGQVVVKMVVKKAVVRPLPVKASEILNIENFGFFPLLIVFSLFCLYRGLFCLLLRGLLSTGRSEGKTKGNQQQQCQYLLHLITLLLC